MVDLNSLVPHFLPELILVLGALAVISYDLVVRGRDARQAWIAGGFLLAAAGATVFLTGLAPMDVFAVHATDGSVLRAGSFVSDQFTHFFRLVSILTTLLVLVSGVTYMRPRTAFKGEFYGFLLLAAVAMNLMAGANDLIMIALAVEFLSITSYILTAFLRGDPLSGEGALKYFIYGSVTSAAMLYGLVLVYGATGVTTLPDIAAVATNPTVVFGRRVAELMLPALILVTAGVGFKIALVPFHQWSPDAYQGAPTPVTSFLSIGPKAAGFALLIRVLMSAFDTPVFTPQWIGVLTGLSLLTMIVGNLIALSQTDVKRMMAYSSIAQAGYMLVGVISVGSGAAILRADDPVAAAALSSVLIYVLAYLFTNAGAFAVIIAVDHATGSSQLGAFQGLIRRSPMLAVSLFIFFLSLVGIPPLAGFIGKFSVFRAALSADQTTVAVVGVLTGVISVGYYFKVVKAMFFDPAPEDAPAITLSPSLRFVTVMALFLTFAMGLYAAPFIELADTAVAGLLGPLLETETVGAVLP